MSLPVWPLWKIFYYHGLSHASAEHFGILKWKYVSMRLLGGDDAPSLQFEKVNTWTPVKSVFMSAQGDPSVGKETFSRHTWVILFPFTCAVILQPGIRVSFDSNHIYICFLP